MDRICFVVVEHNISICILMEKWHKRSLIDLRLLFARRGFLLFVREASESDLLLRWTFKVAGLFLGLCRCRGLLLEKHG